MSRRDQGRASPSHERPPNGPSALRAAEDAFQEGLTPFVRFLEDLPVAVLVAEASGTPYYANAAARDLLGKGVDPRGGLGRYAEVYQAYVAGTNDPYPEERMPLVRALAGERSAVDDMEIRHPDRTIPIEVWGAPVRDATGSIAYAIAAFTDITERRMAETELRRRNGLIRLLQQVATAANDATSIEEAARSILDRVCSHTGWPVGHAYIVAEDATARLLPMRVWHLPDEERFAQFRIATEANHLGVGEQLIERVLVQGRPAWTADVTRDPQFPPAAAARESGLVGAFWFPILAGTEVAGVLEFFSFVPAEPDRPLLATMESVGTVLGRVVERIRIERELRRIDALRAEFIASAAHELRGPIGALSGFASLLATRRDRLSPEETDELVDAIQRGSDRLNELVGSLLDLSQIEHGSLRVEPAPTGLLPVVSSALETAAAPPDTTVGLEIAEDLVVVADPPRLEQVFVNLLTNAYRYGGGSVMLRASARDAAIVISITDDGPGVPDELIPRLFEPFTRGANVGRARGSGLGLAIVQKLVRAMAGEIWYEHAAPQGARFTVSLRRAT